AFPLGSEVGDDDEGHAGVGRHGLEQMLKRLHAARGGADANDGKARSHDTVKRRWAPLSAAAPVTLGRNGSNTRALAGTFEPGVKTVRHGTEAFGIARSYPWPMRSRPEAPRSRGGEWRSAPAASSSPTGGPDHS